MSSMNSIMGVIVGVILIVGVSIPITQDVVTDANLTGLTGTITEFLPIFLAIAGLVLVTGMIRG